MPWWVPATLVSSSVSSFLGTTMLTLRRPSRNLLLMTCLRRRRPTCPSETTHWILLCCLESPPTENEKPTEEGTTLCHKLCCQHAFQQEEFLLSLSYHEGEMASTTGWCILYKMTNHVLVIKDIFHPTLKTTTQTWQANTQQFAQLQTNIWPYQHSIIPWTIPSWNLLPEAVAGATLLEQFKVWLANHLYKSILCVKYNHLFYLTALLFN